VKVRRQVLTVLTAWAAALGVVSLMACSSDHPGSTTAPTSLTTGATGSNNHVTTQDHGGDDHSTPGNQSPSPNQGPGNSNLSGDGRVTSLVTGTACPTLSFMIGTVKVTLAATTTFERGTCADIVVGAKVHVNGTRLADGSVTATGVQVEAAENEDRDEPVEGEGVITALKTGTTCPTLTFSIGTKSISVTATTVFDRGACVDLVVGARVHVKGSMTGDNVVATQIEVQQAQTPGHPVVEGDARVAGLVAGTTCPALKFMAEEWTVTLDASTTFVGGTCADIAVGKKVGVKGTVTAEHAVLASQIVFKANDN